MKKVFAYAVALILMSGAFYSCSLNDQIDDVTIEELEAPANDGGDEGDTPDTTPPPPPNPGQS